MRRPLLAAALLSIALVGCNAVTLTDLKCAGDCQVTADPFRLNLQVTYDDPNRRCRAASCSPRWMAARCRAAT